ncbi:hypothetical protein [Streptomyces sp. AP-93]|uniref:hypothetical protein n=1 Tax=Streptomyces sp. AP-93 TaxID=2929048 RepID=UPI001FAFD33D|nr:hypothetical protein [Streptomyces sp. AP-93]MCJ0875730.1 hypothetical protein [Streptomyces sp. AP-93]
MQLRRVLPLSLVALLASAGCVSVGGPRDSDVPARGFVPPADAPELSPPPDASPAADPVGLPAEPLPLGELPARADAYADRADADRDGGKAPSRPAAKAPRPAAERRAKPAAPRRAHPPKAAAARPDRPARNPVAPLPRTDELCAAAEGSLPPSIVDLCIRQAGR